MIDYTTDEHYCCADCGAIKVRLWRDYNTFLEQQTLRCRPCAMINQGKSEEDLRGDQIGWLVPAVPTSDGSTFWGYSSVPQDGCNWWYSLPVTVEEANSALPVTVGEMLHVLDTFRVISVVSTEGSIINCSFSTEHPGRPATLSLRDGAWHLRAWREKEATVIRTRGDLGPLLARLADRENVRIAKRNLSRALADAFDVCVDSEVTASGGYSFFLAGNRIASRGANAIYFIARYGLQAGSIERAVDHARAALTVWLRRTKSGRYVSRGKTYRTKSLALAAIARG